MVGVFHLVVFAGNEVIDGRFLSWTVGSIQGKDLYLKGIVLAC